MQGIIDTKERDSGDLEGVNATLYIGAAIDEKLGVSSFDIERGV